MERSLEEELLSVFSEEGKLLQDINSCEMQIASSIHDLANMEVLLDKLQDLQAKADSAGAYNLASRVRKAAASLGFIEDDLHRRVGSFSGGWKMRIGLAKILCQDPYVFVIFHFYYN